MKKINVKQLLNSFILFLIIFTFFTPPIKAIEYGGFGGRPAYPDPDNPRTESIFVFTMEPGDNKKDGVKIINNSAESKTIIVYTADSTPSTGGAFACEQIAEEKNNVGGWITLTKNEVVLKPATNEIIPFSVNVPMNAGVGEHNGCILITEKKAPVKGSSGVSLSTRIGLRVSILVPGETIRNLEILGFSFYKKSGKYLLQPRIKNTGNVSIDSNVKVVTRSIFGKAIATHGGMYPILRGDTTELNYILSHPFWGGLYFSKLKIQYDSNPEAGVGTNTGKPLTTLDSKTIWFVTPPTARGFIFEILILIMLFIGFKKFKQWKKSSKTINDTWVEYIIEENDDINTLADKFNISWKLLAKVNKLNPPYVLKQGKNIKVPPTD